MLGSFKVCIGGYQPARFCHCKFDGCRRPGRILKSTAIGRLESRQNPHAGKRALRSAAFPGCGLTELSSSARGALLRRTLAVLSGCVLSPQGWPQFGLVTLMVS